MLLLPPARRWRRSHLRDPGPPSRACRCVGRAPWHCQEAQLVALPAALFAACKLADCPQAMQEGCARGMQQAGQSATWPSSALPRPAPPHLTSALAAPACLQLEGGVLLTGEGGRDGRVHVWDAGQAADGRPPTLASTLGPHVGGVSCLAYQRDTGAVAVGSVRGELRLWDLARWGVGVTVKTSARARDAHRCCMGWLQRRGGKGS